MNLNDWMVKFAPIVIWANGQPTKTALRYYKYFYLDLLAAWERNKYCGAREVLAEAERRFERVLEPVLNIKVSSMREYPAEVKVIEITDCHTMRQGYERYIEEGKFVINGVLCHELVWHRHDGYGEEAGTVELFAWR